VLEAFLVGRGWRDDRRVHDGAGADRQALGLQIAPDLVKELLAPPAEPCSYQNEDLREASRSIFRRLAVF